MRTLLAIPLLIVLALAVSAQSMTSEQWQQQREKRELVAKIDKANEKTDELVTRVQEHRIAMENRITKIESSQRIAEWAITGLITAAIGMVGNIVRERLTKAKS